MNPQHYDYGELHPYNTQEEYMASDATRGTLGITEVHPAAYDAQRFIASLPPHELAMWSESFASCAIEGNRLAEVCSETLNRLMHGEPVSDRYILGLAFTIMKGLKQLKAEPKEKVGIVDDVELQSVKRLMAELEAEIQALDKDKPYDEVIVARSIEQRQHTIANLKSQIAAYEAAHA